MTLLEVQNIVKEYKAGVRANDGLSLHIAAGEVFGLLGPNGAGKTTLVNQIIGLVGPTSGHILVDGVDTIADPDRARQLCSFQPQTQVPIDGVTPRQAIGLVGRLRGGEPSAVRRRTEVLIEALDIGQWADVSGEHLSGGVRRLTAFCMAVVVPGKLVILDEPTNDVDPMRRRRLWDEVRRLAEQGSAVLLVTHNVLEAERSVDRLAVIDQGRVVAAGTAASLKGYENGYLRLELVLEPNAGRPKMPDFAREALLVGRRLISRVAADDVTRAVAWAQQIKREGIAEEYGIGPATLEDVYVRIVGHPEVQGAHHKEVDHVVSTPLAA